MTNQFFILAFLLISGSITNNYLNAYDQNVYDAGQKQFEAIVADSRHPKYGPCWTKVLDEVRLGCRKLTEDTQHRLALGFTNCFLAKTGRQTYDGCESNGDGDEEKEISTCVRDMDSAAFNAYTNFFTHAQSLCYFLENVRWQENAELTINRLIEQTLNFEERLRAWNASVLAFESRTLHLESHLLEAGSKLTTSLDQSQAAVAIMRQASADQHAIIRDVFRQLTSLQEMVVDEFAGFYAYAYYVASTGLAYVLTSTQRTDAARVPLLTVTSSTFAVERFVLRRLLTFFVNFQAGDLTGSQEISNTTMHMAVWWLRRVAVFLCLVLLAWSTVRFRDLHVINHSLLEGVAREQRHLRRIYSQIAHLRNAIRERSLTPTNNNNTRPPHHHHHNRRDEAPTQQQVGDEAGTPTPNGKAISAVAEKANNTRELVSTPQADADDEGDGGNDDNISLAGSTVSSLSRYNLRSSARRSLMASPELSPLRELTPTSTVTNRSRSRSRSRAPSQTPSMDAQLLASVEASAKRTARSARLARLAAQREENS